MERGGEKTRPSSVLREIDGSVRREKSIEGVEISARSGNHPSPKSPARGAAIDLRGSISQVLFGTFSSKRKYIKHFAVRNLKIATTTVVAFLCLLLSSTTHAQTYQTIGPGGCGLGQNNCHATENNWWKNDPHFVTVDAFFADPESYQKIADLSGIGAANMMKGSSSCMKCHGTVVSGKEARDVEEGVSCESCHGPGSGYKDPHQEGEKGTGASRPGYVKGLQLGLVDLKNFDKRAAACVRCHYITDEKLLAAGHPSGARFNYVTGIRTKVAKHWRRPATDVDGDKNSFAKAMSARGPVPKVAAAAPALTRTSSADGGDAPVRRPPPPPRQPRADPSLAPPASLGPIELPEFPEITDSTSVDQVLLLLKKRLELLYKKTGS